MNVHIEMPRILNVRFIAVGRLDIGYREPQNTPSRSQLRFEFVESFTVHNGLIATPKHR